MAFPPTHLIVGGLSDVQQLTPEGENSIIISANDPQSTDCHGLGRISLSDDEGTVQRVLSSCLVGVVKFRNATDLASL